MFERPKPSRDTHIYIYTCVRVVRVYMCTCNTYPPAPLWGTTAVRVIAGLLSLCDNSSLQSLSCSKLSVYSSHCPLSAVSDQCTVYSVQHPSFNGSPTAPEPMGYIKKIPSRVWALKPYKIRYGSVWRPKCIANINV